MASLPTVPSAAGTRRSVAPHFAVAIVNDATILRCELSPGAEATVTDPVRLNTSAPRVLGASRESEAAPGGIASLPPTFLRVLLYSPNLVSDEYPSFAWDADLDVDGTTFYIGSIRRRCDVVEKRFLLPGPQPPRQVQLRLHRLRFGQVRSADSEALAQMTLDVMQDQKFNPRGGSLPLQALAEEMHKRHPREFRAVVGTEHLGSFRAFLSAHQSRFSIFHYQESEIKSRNMPNVTPYDERVAIRKGVRDSMPPLMAFVTNEAEVIQILKDALKDSDSSVHMLMRRLSKHEVFRVGMAAGFSVLMHWLQRHRELFCWSTDPQAVCMIGLARHRGQIDELSRNAGDNDANYAATLRGEYNDAYEGDPDDYRQPVDEDDEDGSADANEFAW
jgi:hypothetical protein